MTACHSVYINTDTFLESGTLNSLCLFVKIGYFFKQSIKFQDRVRTKNLKEHVNRNKSSSRNQLNTFWTHNDEGWLENINETHKVQMRFGMTAKDLPDEHVSMDC